MYSIKPARLNAIMQRIFGEAYEVVTVKQNGNHKQFYMFVYLGDTLGSAPEVMFAQYDFFMFLWKCIDKIHETYPKIERKMREISFVGYWNELILVLNADENGDLYN